MDVESFLPTTHGVRDIDTITRLGLPGVNPEVEAQAIALSDLNAVEGIDAIAGAAALLESLPADRSGDRDLRVEATRFATAPDCRASNASRASEPHLARRGPSQC